MKERLITVLELGTTKISVIISSINNDNKLEIRGVGTAESAGIDKGIVTDLKIFSEAIQSAITIAEESAKLTAENLYVSISGEFIVSKVTTGRISLVGSNGPSEILQVHIEQVINDAKQDLKKHHINEKYEIIHCIPQYFCIDSQSGISNPIGMIGYALSVSTLIIMADIAPMRNIRKAIEMTGFNEVEFVFAPIASAKAVLNEDEKKLGSLMLDFGGGTCDLLIMNRNFTKLAVSLSKGSQLVTQDLSVQLKTPPRFAETLKLELGNCYANSVDHETTVSIDGIGGRASSVAHLHFISQIIEARMREILEDTYRFFLNNFQEAEYLTAGIVLTGGAALTQNIVVLCEEIFNMPVRIGYPEFSLISGPVSRLDMPSNATIIGLLYFALEQETEGDEGGRVNMNISKNINGFFKNIIKLFKDFS